MSFNGNEGQPITLEQGGEFTAAYRATNPNGIKGVFFGRDHIERILSQGDCKGLRLYFAKNTEGNPTLVMVGADSAENDQLDLILDQAMPCPTRCSSSNALNNDAEWKNLK